MTLLDAPKFDATKAHRRGMRILYALIVCLVIAGFAWYFWNWPQEHLINQFFATVEGATCPPSVSGTTIPTGKNIPSDMRDQTTGASPMTGVTEAIGAISSPTKSLWPAPLDRAWLWG